MIARISVRNWATDIGSSDAAKLISVTFLAAVLARGAQMVVAVLLARILAPEGFGLFTFAVGAGLLAGHLGTLGWPVLAARLTPEYQARSDWGALRGLILSSDLVVLAGGLTVTIMLWAGSWAPGLSSHLATGLSLAAIVAIPAALRNLRRQQLAAFGLPGQGLLFDEAIAPTAVFITILIAGVWSAGDAVLAYAAGSILGVAAATVLLWQHAPAPVRSANRESHWGIWAAIALPGMAGLSGKLLLAKTDVLMLAPLASMEEVGLYGAAFRLTYLLTFPQVVMATVMTPRFSAAIANGDGRSLRRRFFGALAFAAATAIPTAVVLVLAPEFTMTLVFGAEFRMAGASLVVLAIAMAFGACAIPVGGLLLMGGRERFFGVVNVAALGLNVTANLVLIPVYGSLGAAIATLLTTVLLFAIQGVVAIRIAGGRAPLLAGSASASDGG